MVPNRRTLATSRSERPHVGAILTTVASLIRLPSVQSIRAKWHKSEVTPWSLLQKVFNCILRPKNPGKVTICNGSCSCLGQSLPLVRAWTILIMGYLWLFILWFCGTLNFCEYRLIGVLSFALLPLYSPQYFMDPVHVWYSCWPWLEHELYWLMRSICLFYRVKNSLLELGRPRVPFPWAIFLLNKMLLKMLSAKRLPYFALGWALICHVYAPLEYAILKCVVGLPYFLQHIQLVMPSRVDDLHILLRYFNQDIGYSDTYTAFASLSLDLVIKWTDFFILH